MMSPELSIESDEQPEPAASSSAGTMKVISQQQGWESNDDFVFWLDRVRLKSVFMDSMPSKLPENSPCKIFIGQKVEHV